MLDSKRRKVYNLIVVNIVELQSTKTQMQFVIDEGLMTIGERIMKLRGGVPRSDVAMKLGIHPQTLYLYEKDKRSMDVAVLKSMCELYSVSADWIIFGEDGITKEQKEYINSLQMQLIEAQKQLLNLK